MKEFSYSGKYFQVFNKKEGAQALSNNGYMKKVLSIKYRNCKTLEDFYGKAALTANISFFNKERMTPYKKLIEAVLLFEEHFDKELKGKFFMVIYKARKVSKENVTEMTAVFIPLFTMIDIRQIEA